jgi:hypothetical protein
MRRLSREVGIAGAIEHPQVLTNRLAGKTVQQIHGSLEPIYPVANWERSLKEQGANHVIYGVKSMFGFTILQRSVGIGHL